METGPFHRRPMRRPTEPKPICGSWRRAARQGAPAYLFAARRETRRAQSAVGAGRVGHLFPRASWRKHTDIFGWIFVAVKPRRTTLKILPTVDESKEKDAIPPPGAEKNGETKSATRQSEDAEEADASPEQIAFEVSGYVMSGRRQVGRSVGARSADTRARRSRAMRRRMLRG